MTTDIFIDGASEVSVHNGIVRINLVTLAATEKDAKGTAGARGTAPANHVGQKRQPNYTRTWRRR